MTNQPPKLQVVRGMVPHNLVADLLLYNHTFKTLSDTEDLLCYDKSSGLYLPNGEVVAKAEIEKGMNSIGHGQQATRAYVNEVIGHIKRSTYIDREQLNATPNLLPVRNGVLNLSTLKLYPHSSSYLFTIGIPVFYNPEATCPQVEQFFHEIVKGEDVSLLYELVGWCLDRQSPQQRIVLLLGEGANGKSTFIELLRRLLGQKNCSGINLQALVTNRFSTSRLYGKLANLYPDLPSAALSETGILKGLTGGDVLDAEEKFKAFFSFRNTAKLIFSANQAPRLRDDTLAIWRRFIIVDFPNLFIGEKDDKKLGKKLSTPQELSGLLNLALEALKRLKRTGAFSYKLTIPETRQKYHILSDPVPVFVEEMCEQDSTEYISKEDLYQAYIQWSKKKKAPALTKKGFGHQIKEGQHALWSQTYWRGISLK